MLFPYLIVPLKYPTHLKAFERYGRILTFVGSKGSFKAFALALYITLISAPVSANAWTFFNGYIDTILRCFNHIANPLWYLTTAVYSLVNPLSVVLFM